MEYLIKPHNGIWVAVQDGLTEDSLRQRILNVDVCLADLDDTDAHSPAKQLAFQDIIGGLANPEYQRWFFQSLLALRDGLQEAEHQSWKGYVNFSLRTPEQRQKAAAEFIVYLKDFFYSGVPELYSLMPGEKYYASRNILEVVDPFAQFLNFNGCYAEVDDKERFTHSFVLDHPQFRNYLVREDAHDGNGMVEALRFYARNGKIDSVVFQHCADKPGHNPSALHPDDNRYFHFQTGKDQTGLVELLRGRHGK